MWHRLGNHTQSQGHTPFSLSVVTHKSFPTQGHKTNPSFTLGCVIWAQLCDFWILLEITRDLNGMTWKLGQSREPEMDSLWSGRSEVGFSHTPRSPTGIAERSGQQGPLLFPVTSESEWSLKQTDFIHKSLDTKAERDVSTGLSRTWERANP